MRACSIFENLFQTATFASLAASEFLLWDSAIWKLINPFMLFLLDLIDALCRVRPQNFVENVWCREELSMLLSQLLTDKIFERLWVCLLENDFWSLTDKVLEKSSISLFNGVFLLCTIWAVDSRVNSTRLAISLRSPLPTDCSSKSWISDSLVTDLNLLVRFSSSLWSISVVIVDSLETSSKYKF